MLSEMTLPRCLLCPGPAWQGQQGAGTLHTEGDSQGWLGHCLASRHCSMTLQKEHDLRRVEWGLGPDLPPQSYMTKPTLRSLSLVSLCVK